MAANMADLVDLLAYWLQSEYAKWIYDPEDPETKQRERERKRSRVKPPPHPIIPPVAHRPPTVRDTYLRTYLAQLEEHPGGEPVKKHVTSDEFDRALGLI